MTVCLKAPGAGRTVERPATTAAATNRLFRAAQFELSEPGRWKMQVRVLGRHGPAGIGGEVDVAEPLPRWQEMWPWFTWPALAIALFGIHQALVLRSGAQTRRAKLVLPAVNVAAV